MAGVGKSAIAVNLAAALAAEGARVALLDPAELIAALAATRP